MTGGVRGLSISGDARGLVERIEAHLRERIEEAAEMAALKLMVDLRAESGRPAPSAAPPTARVRDDLGPLVAARRPRGRAAAGLRPHREVEAAAGEQAARLLAPAGWRAPARLLAGLERYQCRYAAERLASPGEAGWLKRLSADRTGASTASFGSAAQRSPSSGSASTPRSRRAAPPQLGRATLAPLMRASDGRQPGRRRPRARVRSTGGQLVLQLLESVHPGTSRGSYTKHVRSYTVNPSLATSRLTF
jgi:hypothetical protein